MIDVCLSVCLSVGLGPFLVIYFEESATVCTALCILGKCFFFPLFHVIR